MLWPERTIGRSSTSAKGGPYYRRTIDEPCERQPDTRIPKARRRRVEEKGRGIGPKEGIRLNALILFDEFERLAPHFVKCVYLVAHKRSPRTSQRRKTAELNFLYARTAAVVLLKRMGGKASAVKTLQPKRTRRKLLASFS